MSKDRPIKNFRLEGERPFKAYNLGISASLFADSRHLDQQQTSLSRSASGQVQQQTSLSRSASGQVQHQQLRLRQHQQHHLSAQSSQRQQQTFNDPSDYLRIRSHFQLGQQNPTTNPDHFTYDYEDVTQDVPNNQLTTSNLEVSNGTSPFQHGELDLNLPNITTSNNGLQNFIMPPRSSYRAPISGSLGDQDTVSMLLENSMALFSNGLPRVMDHATSTNYSSFNNSHLPQSFSTPFPRGATHVNGINLHDRAMAFSENTVNLPVKQEFHESGFTLSDRPNPSISSTEHNRGIYHNSLKYNKDGSKADCSVDAITGKEMSPNSHQNDSNDDKSPEDAGKDQTYTEKRRKNNESAKRSREARRAKEELVALRVVGLEQENMRLQAEICMLGKELDELRAQVY